MLVTVEERSHRSAASHRLRVHLTVRPAGSQTVLIRPNVRRVTLILRGQIRERRTRRKLHLRRAGASVDCIHQVAAGHRTLGVETTVLIEQQNLRFT